MTLHSVLSEFTDGCAKGHGAAAGQRSARGGLLLLVEGVAKVRRGVGNDMHGGWERRSVCLAHRRHWHSSCGCLFLPLCQAARRPFWTLGEAAWLAVDSPIAAK